MLGSRYRNIIYKLKTDVWLPGKTRPGYIIEDVWSLLIQHWMAEDTIKTSTQAKTNRAGSSGNILTHYGGSRNFLTHHLRQV